MSCVCIGDDEEDLPDDDMSDEEYDTAGPRDARTPHLTSASSSLSVSTANASANTSTPAAGTSTGIAAGADESRALDAASAPVPAASTDANQPAEVAAASSN